MSKENLGEFEELVLLMVAVLKEESYGLAICDELPWPFRKNYTIFKDVMLNDPPNNLSLKKLRDSPFCCKPNVYINGK